MLALTTVAGAAFAQSQGDQFGGVAVTTTEEASVSGELGVQDDRTISLNQRQKYFEVLAKYRDSERQFLISREQYYQLNTLAAQDEAVVRARRALIDRADTLQNYFVLLQLQLSASRAVPAQVRDFYTNVLSAEIGFLTSELTAVETVQNRAEAQSAFLRLNERSDQITHEANAVLAVLLLGRMQQGLDEAQVLISDLRTWLPNSNLSAAEQAKRKRGIDEAELLLEEVQKGINRLGIRIAPNEKNEIPALAASTFRSFQDEAEPVYAQLRQVHSFLTEAAL